jgi:gliding motility-associated-like protein
MRILLIMFLLSISLGIKAQTPNWINSIGSLAADDSYSIDFDDSGNVYLAGWFSGTADFDPSPSTYNLTSAGSTDVFVAKYSNSGQFIWAFKIGQTDRDGAMKVKVNNAGEVIVTGFVRQNNIDFDPGPGSFLLNAPGLGGTDPGHSGDIFLAKYTSNGQFNWAFIISGSYNSDLGESIEVDNQDNIYLVGAINATSTTVADADPGPGVYNLAGQGKGHAFVAKYTTNSNFIWAIQMGTYGLNSSTKRIRMVPGDTTFVICGHHSSTNADFDPGPGVFQMNSNGNVDMFTGRYSINGNFVWALGAGGSAQDLGMELRLDSANNVYVSGSFSGSNVDFNPGAALNTLTSNGASDGYLAKYDILGNFIWANNIGGSGNDFNWTFDIFGNKIVASGEFTQTADFDPSPATYNLVSNGLSDAYFAQYDLSGNFLCATSIGGVGVDKIFSMEKSSVDTFFTCGSYSSSVDFDPNPTVLVKNSVGLVDAFLGKYNIGLSSSPLNATLIGDTICSGEAAYLTLILPPGFSGTFNVTFTDGVNVFNANGVSSGLPFLVPISPTVTTNYTIQFITFTSVTGCDNTFSLINSNVSIYVTPSPQITATASPTSFCPGGSTTLNGNGGVSYTWSGGVSNGVSFVPASTSSYTVTGTDANGCTNTSSITITVFPLPNVTANANPANICPGAGTTLTGSGASNYTWTGGVSNGVMIYPTSTSTYTVTGTDANGCTNTSSVTVSVNNNLNVNISPTQNTLCLGDSLQFTATGATNYVWSFTPGLSSYTGASVWAFPSTSTAYTVTGSDANGCSGTSVVNVEVVNQIEVIASKNRDAECNQNLIQLSASGAQNYTWTPASGLSNPTSAVTNATIYSTSTFYVTGTLGTCSDMDSIVVYNYNNDENSIFIPNAFTPNNDGNNDCLRIRHNAKFTKYYFTIYNRWGEKVFEADNPDACWNGEYKNKPAELDTYFYYLKAESVCGPIFRKGDIVIMR